MLRGQVRPGEGDRQRLTVGFAHGAREVEEAQRLRYAVFAEEMGARLAGPMPGIDADRFDEHCEHLVVRDRATGEVVGTYRILSPARAAAAGGYYSEQEFDLARLAHLRPGLVELGRSCIHPDYRTGGAIALLWAGLARYMRDGGYRHLMGCASISMADGGHTAANLYRGLATEHFAPPEYRVFPRCRLPVEDLANGAPVALPPLLKGYLRVGAYVCGEPAWDPDFNTADVLVLMSMAQVSGRYARHYLGESAAAEIEAC